MNMMFVGDNVVLIVCWCQLCHGMMVFQLSKLSLCQCISVLLRWTYCDRYKCCNVKYRVDVVTQRTHVTRQCIVLH